MLGVHSFVSLAVAFVRQHPVDIGATYRPLIDLPRPRHFQAYVSRGSKMSAEAMTRYSMKVNIPVHAAAHQP